VSRYCPTFKNSITITDYPIGTVNKPFEWRNAPKANFAVLGDPISHSLSPKIHKAAYDALGLKYDYVAIRAPAEEFEEAVEHLKKLGYIGVNLTQPLKEKGAQWVSHPDEFVRRVGSANTISLIDSTATNTDAAGFLDTLPAIGIWAPAPVLVLGSGGAARSLVAALSDSGHRLKIFNRTTQRAMKLVDDLKVKAEVMNEPNPEGVEMILNTTSAAFDGDSVPVQWYRANKKAIAYDISYGKELSPFLLQAGLGGLKVVDGLEMLVAQAARSLEWWLGMAAPLDVMRRAVG